MLAKFCLQTRRWQQPDRARLRAECPQAAVRDPRVERVRGVRVPLAIDDANEWSRRVLLERGLEDLVTQRCEITSVGNRTYELSSLTSKSNTRTRSQPSTSIKLGLSY